MKKIIALALLFSAVHFLSACNTVNGFGKDLEKVGEKMQEKSAK